MTNSWDNQALGWLAEQIARRPGAPALLSLDREPLSYEALGRLVEATQARLNEIGIGRNDRVAVVLPGGAANAAACLSISAAATCAPLNPDYTTAELEYFLSALRIRLVVTDATGSSPIREAARRLELPVLPTAIAAEGPTGAFALGALEGSLPSGRPELGPAMPADIALVLHTSGSTSLPKIVPLSHRQILASARNVARSLELGEDDRCLNAMPLFHVGALVDLLLAPLSVGGSVIVASDPSSKSFFAVLDELSPSWYQGVPTMLRDLTDRAAREQRAGGPSSLRLIRSVSAPLPTATLEEVEASFGVPVIEIYGMTETAGLITSNPLPPGSRKPGSVGVAAGPEISILDEAGNAVGAGLPGEVVVRGETVMAGYEGDAALNEKAFIGAWLRTGDEGCLDDEGYLRLTGRIKEIINRGGEKIAPREIDELALSHEKVAEAAAFALPHESLGEEVALAVVPRAGETIDEHELIDFLSERLAYFKVPRVVFLRDDLPRGGSGKLQRHRLAEAYGAPGATNDRPEWVAPESATAQLLAKMWERALGISGIGLHDNFFDLGGDSLKAATFINELQAELDQPLPVTTLFEAPTIALFEARLARSGEEEGSTGLREEIHRGLASYLSAWKGARLDADALLVGRNTLGTRPPLFWGLQAFPELESLSSHLSADQPIYGFRSLYKLDEKSAESNRELSARYAREIVQIQPEGPLLIGGFCEAGKIAFTIACSLREAGRDVRLLGLQEQFVPEPYDGRVALFFCAPSELSPYHHFHRPELGWSKLYTGKAFLYSSEAPHEEYYAEDHIGEFAAQLDDAIRQALADTDSDTLASRLEATSDGAAALQVLPPQAYRARLVADAARFMAPGSRHRIEVEVHNESSVPWLASARSGVWLANRWINHKGRRKIPLDGRAPLPVELAPGESVRIPLAICAPQKRRDWTLEIDLVDEGVTWFDDAGSASARLPVRVSRGAAIRNLLSGKGHRRWSGGR